MGGERVSTNGGDGYLNGNGTAVKWQQALNNILNGLVAIILMCGGYLYTEQQEVIGNLAERIVEQRVSIAEQGAEFRQRLLAIERQLDTRK